MKKIPQIPDSYHRLREALSDTDFVIKKVELEQGDTLFNQGDPSDALYFINSGILEASITQKNGREVKIAKMGPGEPIGEIGLIVRARRSAKVYAVEKSILTKLDKSIFEHIAKKSPEIIQEMAEIIRRRLRRSQLASSLPELFGPIDEIMLQVIEKEVEWIHLDGDEYLFRQGDKDSSLYIVISGRLHAFIEKSNGDKQLLNEITRGESIGEMALLTEEPRAASIQAVRDSKLVKISSSTFWRIAEKYPQIIKSISRLVVNRLQKKYSSPYASRVTNIAVLPFGKDINVTKFARRLTTSLSELGSTLHISSRILNDLLDIPEAADFSSSNFFKDRLAVWIEEQESKYRFIIYETDRSLSPWTKRCVRQADRILYVADASRDTAAPKIGDLLSGINARPISGRQFLVLTYNNNISLPSGTSHWLSALKVDAHYHVRWQENADFIRLARILGNNAVGLVLGGGGARGFAHIGVIKALEEKGLPIDLIGGTSIGSIIAALYAMGWDCETMLQKSKELFLKKKPLNDFTLPLISLIKGRKFDRISQEVFGEACIEDLWLNYFCVSCNLTDSKVFVSDKGPVWKAIRASSSLPGILAPVLDKGKVLIDGGILNNLPGDVMRKKDAGIVIVVDVNPQQDLKVNYDVIPSPWKVLLNKLLPSKKAANVPVPDIATVLMRTTIINSIHNADTVILNSDLYLQPPIEQFGLLEFKSFERIAEAGYSYAKEKLKSFNPFL
jgi:NTE family protein/lysophospholipid hydrolase